MKTIYLVMGTAGEYSDRTEWPVVAYLESHLAEEHVTLATQEANRLWEEVDKIYEKPYAKFYEYLEQNKNPYDLEMQTSYHYRPSYFIYVIELEEGNKVTKLIGENTNGT